MADTTKESKDKKLAAARKKLKEYQSRGKETSATSSIMTTSSTSVANSEHSECELNAEIGVTTPNTDTPNLKNNNGQVSISNYFQTSLKDTTFEENTSEQHVTTTQQHTMPLFESISVPNAGITSSPLESFQQLQEQQQHHQQIDTMQLLVNEKTQLSAELNRWRNLCREKDAILEDLRTQLNRKSEEFESVQENLKQQKQSTEQIRNFNAELMHKLSQANVAQEEHTALLNELKQKLKLSQIQIDELENKLKEQSKDLELSQLRIEQLSNVQNSKEDETLNKNKFMYEQQIRDLQAMVQQFTLDKDQSSSQFQNYVQHLNAEIATLSEKNSELTDTTIQLQERERQLVEHVSQLEKEIQKNLSLRQTSVGNQQTTNAECSSVNQIEDLKKQIENYKERINLDTENYELERHEFQLKIKSQEDRLNELQKSLNEKLSELEKISEHISEQPDQVKLLATMESDKIAASRALTQNIELKKQLDELELRFVQLTNDKAELTNELDREKFENRERRTNYTEMEQRLLALDEKFQYKDAEMIRLSHENMELTRQNLELQQQIDNLKHFKDKEYNNYDTNDENFKNGLGEDDHQDDHHHHLHNDNCSSDNINHKTNIETDSCQEAYETENCMQKSMSTTKSKETPNLATEEAVEKLQARFTNLMTQIADLTDEKQRLEHLVLQLQGETETIGEYITLYQTQRRILKQREYEKSAQTRLLQEEREKLREKVAQLNELVNKLGLFEKTTTTKLDTNDIKNRLHEALSETHDDNNENLIIDKNVGDIGDLVVDFPTSTTKNAFPNDILLQIQNIVTEIKENTTKDVPLLNTTTNNAVEICHCCEGQLKIV